MPTYREQSFLGTLRFGAHPLHTLEALNGAPVWVNWLGGPSTLPGLTSTVREDSHLLGCQLEAVREPILLYFRQSAEGYRLYVREPGRRFGHGVKAFDRYLGLAPVEQTDPEALLIKDSAGELVSLAGLEGDQHDVVLHSASGPLGLSHRSHSHYSYLTTPSDTPVSWTLQIVERNVPWLSQPYER